MKDNGQSLSSFDYNNKTFMELLKLQYENFSKNIYLFKFKVLFIINLKTNSNRKCEKLETFA